MKNIIVNVMPEEVRIAIKEGEELIALELERPHHEHLVGNVYKGVVQNVLPGMQAAFVDIGRSKNAYLYIGDGKADTTRQGKRTPIHVGQVLPVQITKEEVGTKGPRATLHLAIPGRSVVLLPKSSYIGTSHKIQDAKERKRLFDIAKAACPEGMGVILRTAAAGQEAESIRQDISSLASLWQSVEKRQKSVKNTGLIYQDADIVLRIVRDFFTDDVETMVIDEEKVYNKVVEMLQELKPQWAEKVQLYRGRDIFAEYGIEQAANRLGDRQVQLKSGGFLVIDKTEAMTVIDVNTGSFVGNLNLGETAFALNQEAAREVMRQLRLRDIGGIVLVDFIDMEKPAYNEALLQQMRQLAQQDPTKVNVVDITSLGLVEITRKKSRHNLESLQHADCPVCHGTGRILSTEAMAVKICRDIRRIEAESHAAWGYELRLWPENMRELHTLGYLDQLKKELGIEIRLIADGEMMPGCYSLLR